MDIEGNILKYIQGNSSSRGIGPTERYASFDYCFNYFQSFKESGTASQIASHENLQQSCLQLGFYLASWGMLRGSTALRTKSMKIYEPVLRYIAGANEVIWEIDANSYTNENIEALIEFESQLYSRLCFDGSCPSITLTTKIMLGVFGNVPAFDTNFKKGLGAYTFGKKSLQNVRTFYNNHQELIEKYCIPTLEFSSGKPSTRKYTRAKVIDMVFFIEGGAQQSHPSNS
jgi:hypothetical protein